MRIVNLHFLARKEEVRGQGSKSRGLFSSACKLCGWWSLGVTTRRVGRRVEGGR